MRHLQINECEFVAGGDAVPDDAGVPAPTAATVEPAAPTSGIDIGDFLSTLRVLVSKIEDMIGSTHDSDDDKKKKKKKKNKDKD